MCGPGMRFGERKSGGKKYVWCCCHSASNVRPIFEITLFVRRAVCTVQQHTRLSRCFGMRANSSYTHRVPWIPSPWWIRATAPALSLDLCERTLGSYILEPICPTESLFNAIQSFFLSNFTLLSALISWNRCTDTRVLMWWTPIL